MALLGSDGKLLEIRIWIDGVITVKPSYTRYLATYLTIQSDWYTC